MGLEGICPEPGLWVHPCSSLSIPAHLWSSISIPAHPCPSMSISAYLCPSLPRGTRREGIPSSQPSRAQGPCPAAPPSPDLTAQAHGDKHSLLPWAQGGDSTIPSDNGRVKMIPWEFQVYWKAPGGSRCQGAEEDPWCADHSCFFQLDQQLPTGQSSWEICLGMFDCCRRILQSLVPTVWSWAVLGFASIVAAQHRECLQTGTVRWTGKVKGRWGMGNHLKFMLHTTENPSWKTAGLKGSKIHPVCGRERRGHVGTGKLSLIFPPGK